jgi:hypothetical protein
MPRQPNNTAAPHWARDSEGRPITQSGRQLKTDPHNVRIRLRRQRVKSVRDMELLYGKQFSEWDLEELAKGKCKNPVTGRFHAGPRADWLASPIMAEIRQRFIDLTLEKLDGQVPFALDVLRKLMVSEERDEFGKYIVEPRVKLDAAKFIIEHVIGKPRQRVDISGDDALKKIMAAALVMPNGDDAHPVIDGELVGKAFDEMQEED